MVFRRELAHQALPISDVVVARRGRRFGLRRPSYSSQPFALFDPPLPVIKQFARDLQIERYAYRRLSLMQPRPPLS